MDTLLVLGTVYWCAPTPHPRPVHVGIGSRSQFTLPAQAAGEWQAPSQAAVTTAVAQDELRAPGRCQGHSRTQAACQRPCLSAHTSVAQHTLQTQAPACAVGPGQPFPFHLSPRPIPGTQLLMEGLDVPKEAPGSGAQVCLPEQQGQGSKCEAGIAHCPCRHSHLGVPLVALPLFPEPRSPNCRRAQQQPFTLFSCVVLG